MIIRCRLSSQSSIRSSYNESSWLSSFQP